MAELEKVAELADWQLFIVTNNSNEKWTNFRLQKSSPPEKKSGQGKKRTYWSAFNGARLAQNADAALLRKNLPELYHWVMEKLGDYRNGLGMPIGMDKPVKDFANFREADQFWSAFNRKDDGMIELPDGTVYLFYLGERNDGQQSFAVLLDGFIETKRRKLWLVTDESGLFLPIGDFERIKSALNEHLPRFQLKVKEVLNVKR